MKKLIKFFVCFALATAMCLPLVGCGGNAAKTAADYGFGTGQDGTAIAGTFTYSDDKIESTDKDIAARVYTLEKSAALGFEVEIKAGEATTGDKSEVASVGGYAYYVDADNFVSFMFSKGKKELNVKTKKGYDEQSQTINMPFSVKLDDYIKFRTEKIGNEFRFFVANTQVTTITETFLKEGQAALVTDFHTASFKDYKVTIGLAAFTAASLLYETIMPAAGAVGEWESTAANSIERKDTANLESVAFNYNFNTDYSFTATAKQTNAPEAELYGYYGIVGYYQNDNNYVIVFFKGEWVDVVYKNAGDYQWTGGVAIPEYEEGKANEVRFEKIGADMKIYVNKTFIRAISSKTFMRPGMTGFDTNGASAVFTNVELKNLSQFTDVSKNNRVDFNFSHFISKNEDTSAYTTINENCIGGENYGGIVTGYGSIYGLDYVYEVKTNTAFLLAAPGNFIGLMGGYFNDGANESYFTVFLGAGNKVDLFGAFTAGEIEATGGFAGVAKDVPAECLENGILKQEITFKVVKEMDSFKIYMNNAEIYSINVPKLKYSKPGFMANYVGAEFTVL